MLIPSRAVQCNHICPVYEEHHARITPGSNSHVWDLTIFFLSGLLYLMLVIGWDMQTQGKFDAHTLDAFFAQEPGELFLAPTDALRLSKLRAIITNGSTV